MNPVRNLLMGNGDNYYKFFISNGMNKIYEQNSSLLLLLVFTIVSSFIAYHLVIRSYETVFAISALEIVK